MFMDIFLSGGGGAVVSADNNRNEDDLLIRFGSGESTLKFLSDTG